MEEKLAMIAADERLAPYAKEAVKKAEQIVALEFEKLEFGNRGPPKKNRAKALALQILELSETHEIYIHKNPPKYEEAINLVKGIVQKGEKVFITSRYRFVVQRLSAAIAEALEDEEAVVFIDSSLHLEKQREEIIEGFNKPDTKNKVFMSTYDLGGEGLTLKANHIIFMDLPYTNAKLDQAIGRIYRFGQKEEVFVHSIIVPQSIDTDTIEILKDKESLFKRSMRGKVAIKDQDRKRNMWMISLRCRNQRV